MGWKEWLWEENIGKKVTAKVLRKVINGIVVEIESGVFAKIPLYELAWNPQDIKPFYDSIKIGEHIEVVITDVVRKELRIVASVKRLHDEAWKKLSEKYKIGQEVQGSVRALLPSGVFVYLSDGMEGFIPLSEISPHPVKKPEEALFVNDNVTCIVTKIDEERKNLDLSIKGYLKKVAEGGGKRYPLLKEDTSPPSEDRKSPIESVTIETPEIETEEDRIKKIKGIERILVVEDEEGYRKSFQEMLKAMGYKVDVASNGKEGIEKVRKGDYSTAFVDIYMPDLNGFETMKEIRKIKPNLPIVLITGRSELSGDITREDLAIPYTILQKPIGAEEISAILERIAGGQKIPLPSQDRIHIPVMDEVSFSQTVSKAIADSPVGEYERVVEKIMDSTGASASAIFRMDPVTREIEIINSIGIDEERYERIKYQLQYSPVRDVIEEEEEIFEIYGLDEKKARFKHLLSLIDFNSCIGMPIKTAKRCNHALFLFHPEKRHFSGNELLRAETSAQLLGLAIMNVEMKRSLEISQKFINVGRLNIGLEHEIRSRVGSLSNYITALEMNIDKGAMAIRGLVKEIGTEAKELRDLSEQFLKLVKTHDRVGIKEVRIIDCIKDIIRAVEPLAKQDRIYLKFDEPIGLNRLKVSNGLLLEQILLNILLNGIQQIEMENLDRWTGRVEVELLYEEKQELPIKIRVKDNGPGIHKEYFERIFELLFSTNPDGTGMGLYLCQDMIRSLGGRIDVEESVIFGGTTFLIELPDKR